ncbi:MAG: preprotein translocase subunit SecG [Chloroflexi bacterium]|nr:MAG: preprotein translocase subunit SecG [Phototrophicales bacterium]RMF79310.1 MAG: preprotein translocase subunit SecG [Chloroflexota bacterium]
MQDAFQMVSIVISIVLIALVLLQAKGGGLGSLLGGDSGGGGITRTRRGLEKTLFQVTVGFCIAFVAVAILSAIFSR